MIANCPSCGTHYKHEPPVERVRARCGRCDATVDLSRLRPYRIVPTATPTAEQAKRAARHLPIGLDHPALAAEIAKNVARNVPREVAPPAPAAPPVGTPEAWEDEDPLPQIPEMTSKEDYGVSASPPPEGGALAEEPAGEIDPARLGEATAGLPSNAGGGVATFALWVATGMISGTGLSWTMGGTTMTGMIAGAACGAMAGWGWLRWTSPK